MFLSGKLLKTIIYKFIRQIISIWYINFCSSTKLPVSVGKTTGVKSNYSVSYSLVL